MVAQRRSSNRHPNQSNNNSNNNNNRTSSRRYANNNRNNNNNSSNTTTTNNNSNIGVNSIASDCSGGAGQFNNVTNFQNNNYQQQQQHHHQHQQQEQQLYYREIQPENNNATYAPATIDSAYLEDVRKSSNIQTTSSSSSLHSFVDKTPSSTPTVVVVEDPDYLGNIPPTYKEPHSVAGIGAVRRRRGPKKRSALDSTPPHYYQLCSTTMSAYGGGHHDDMDSVYSYAVSSTHGLIVPPSLPTISTLNNNNNNSETKNANDMLLLSGPMLSSTAANNNYELPPIGASPPPPPFSAGALTAATTPSSAAHFRHFTYDAYLTPPDDSAMTALYTNGGVGNGSYSNGMGFETRSLKHGLPISTAASAVTGVLHHNHHHHHQPQQQQQQQQQHQQQQQQLNNYPSSTSSGNSHHHHHQQQQQFDGLYAGYHYQHYQPIQSPPSSTASKCDATGNDDGDGTSSGGGGGYMRHQPTKSESPTISVDDCGSPIQPASYAGSAGGGGGSGHAIRTPPETLEWLCTNYEPCEGASLQRCTIYDHYLNHCAEAGLEAVNSASFGKLIRSVFKGLRTRRLGTRGNSKYHYNGIRIKPSSALVNAVSAAEYSRMNGGGGGGGGGSGGGGAHPPSAGSATSTSTSRNPRRISGTFASSRASSKSLPAAAASLYQLRSRSGNGVNPSGGGGNSDSELTNDDGYTANGDVFLAGIDDSGGGVTNPAADGPVGGYGVAVVADELPVPHATAALPPSTSLSSSQPRRVASATSTTAMTRSTSGGAGDAPSQASAPSIAPGDGQLPRVAMPDLEALEEPLLQLGYTVPHVLKFIDAYADNCARVLESVKHLRFDTIEAIWTEFWQQQQHQLSSSSKIKNGSSNGEGGGSASTGSPTSGDDVSAISQAAGELSENIAIRLDATVVFRLCELAQVERYVERMDVAVYQVIVDMLMPDVLRTPLTRTLSCQIRHFAKSVEQWLRKAMREAVPTRLRDAKLAAARLLSNALTRYSSFNHLAVATRSVIANRQQLEQMYADFCRVDFAVVRAQADWMCNCDAALISTIESDFKENLRAQRTLDQWTEWMEAVVDQVLARYHDQPPSVQVAASKQFLLKWSFYSSLILRDITYRSADSFGSFHLIRLLYDEYMCLLVECRLAKAFDRPIIAVMTADLGQQQSGANSPASAATLAMLPGSNEPSASSVAASPAAAATGTSYPPPPPLQQQQHQFHANSHHHNTPSVTSSSGAYHHQGQPQQQQQHHSSMMMASSMGAIDGTGGRSDLVADHQHHLYGATMMPGVGYHHIQSSSLAVSSSADVSVYHHQHQQQHHSHPYGVPMPMVASTTAISQPHSITVVSSSVVPSSMAAIHQHHLHHQVPPPHTAPATSTEGGAELVGIEMQRHHQQQYPQQQHHHHHHSHQHHHAQSGAAHHHHHDHRRPSPNELNEILVQPDDPRLSSVAAIETVQQQQQQVYADASNNGGTTATASRYIVLDDPSSAASSSQHSGGYHHHHHHHQPHHHHHQMLLDDDDADYATMTSVVVAATTLAPPTSSTAVLNNNNNSSSGGVTSSTNGGCASGIYTNETSGLGTIVYMDEEEDAADGMMAQQPLHGQNQHHHHHHHHQAMMGGSAHHSHHQHHRDDGVMMDVVDDEEENEASVDNNNTFYMIEEAAESRRSSVSELVMLNEQQQQNDTESDAVINNNTSSANNNNNNNNNNNSNTRDKANSGKVTADNGPTPPDGIVESGGGSMESNRDGGDDGISSRSVTKK